MRNVEGSLSFYAQLVEEGSKLEQMTEDMRNYVKNHPPMSGAYQPKRGDICLALFSQDGLWYRARVETVRGPKTDVFFIDYGNVIQLFNLVPKKAFREKLSTQPAVLLYLPSSPNALLLLVNTPSPWSSFPMTKITRYNATRPSRKSSLVIPMLRSTWSSRLPLLTMFRYDLSPLWLLPISAFCRLCHWQRGCWKESHSSRIRPS